MNAYRIKSITNTHELPDLNVVTLAEKLGNSELYMRLLDQPHSNESLLSLWKEISCTATSYYRDQPYPDVSLWNGPYLILSKSAKEVLYCDLKAQGEFLPIQIGDSSYFIFNCLEFGIENEDSTEIEYEDGFEVGVTSLEFKSNDIEEKPIFKSKLEGSRTLFATDRFKQHFDSGKLSGLRFDTNLLEIF